MSTGGGPSAIPEAMLFVVPPLFILAGWFRGTRPEEQGFVTLIALISAIALIPCLLLGIKNNDEYLKGAAYALAIISTTCLAMTIRTRGRPDRGDDEEPQEPVPGGPDLIPFDWDDFERRFWGDVERRGERPRTPVA
jgi:hypothetical protein